MLDSHLTIFDDKSVKFVETQHVKDGVTCDVYKFVNDLSKDLGIIFISKGCATPRQKVLLGETTLEGYISGEGTLIIEWKDASKEEFGVNLKTKEFSKEIGIGDIMQWKADKGKDLVAYEICYPPYQDGRYENLP